MGHLYTPSQDTQSSLQWKEGPHWPPLMCHYVPEHSPLTCLRWGVRECMSQLHWGLIRTLVCTTVAQSGTTVFITDHSRKSHTYSTRNVCLKHWNQTAGVLSLQIILRNSLNLPLFRTCSFNNLLNCWLSQPYTSSANHTKGINNQDYHYHKLPLGGDKLHDLGDLITASVNYLS